MRLLHTLPEFGRVVRHFIVYGACTKRIQHGRCQRPHRAMTRVKAQS